MDVWISGEIAKASGDDQRMVYGWASVCTKAGDSIVDSQDDVIDEDEIESAASEFMTSVRTAKAMHRGGKVGEVIHSLPLTDAIAKALGLESDRRGWIVGVKVHDDAVWKRVKAGELRSFSIGGEAMRVDAEI